MDTGGLAKMDTAALRRAVAAQLAALDAKLGEAPVSGDEQLAVADDEAGSAADAAAAAAVEQLLDPAKVRRAKNLTFNQWVHGEGAPEPPLLFGDCEDCAVITRRDLGDPWELNSATTKRSVALKEASWIQQEQRAYKEYFFEARALTWDDYVAGNYDSVLPPVAGLVIEELHFDPTKEIQCAPVDDAPASWERSEQEPRALSEKGLERLKSRRERILKQIEELAQREASAVVEE